MYSRRDSNKQPESSANKPDSTKQNWTKQQTKLMDGPFENRWKIDETVLCLRLSGWQTNHVANGGDRFRTRLNDHLSAVRHIQRGDRMPKENLQWKVSDAKRLLRAVQKAGFANRRMSLSKCPDGTLTISVAAPSRSELPLDVSRDIEDFVENEWDKHVKPTP
jgi:hypothetical protein